jgi:hypothetical protein
MSERGMMVVFWVIVGMGLEVAVGAEPGGPTGIVRFETAMLVQIRGSNVSVTVRGTVVPPRPWLAAVVFLGPGPGAGTLRGGAVEGGEDVVGTKEIGKDTWMIGSIIEGRG